MRQRGKLAALALAGLLTACSQSVDGEQASARRGEEVFNKHCYVCHAPDSNEVIVGPSLKGFYSNQNPAPLKNGSVLPRTDAAVRELFENGTTQMPPVRGLTEQQLDDVIAYLHTI